MVFFVHTKKTGESFFYLEKGICGKIKGRMLINASGLFYIVSSGLWLLLNLNFQVLLTIFQQTLVLAESGGILCSTIDK